MPPNVECERIRLRSSAVVLQEKGTVVIGEIVTDVSLEFSDFSFAGRTSGKRVYDTRHFNSPCVVAVWGNQGYQPRLAEAPGIWNGTDFEIQFDPRRDAPQWIG